MDVNVGSATDPIEYPGLAHFLEHMLFLGTEKYPEADAYQKYIKQHGGNHNAYTSSENTNYFFDIRPQFLEGALDRFSEQFTHPLFNADYVEREVNAVHSEFTSKIKDDSRRFYSVIKDVFSDEHPYSRFSVGNLETLKDNSNESLRDALLKFYHKNYSANQMTLVILGKEPLTTLKQWATEKFSGIQNSNLVVTEFDQDFFDKSTLPLKIESQSIMDTRSMMLAFPIPSSSKHLDSKPISYLSNLIGHEGNGSLLSALKKEGLVDSLSSGSQFDTRVKELFVIQMGLTQRGYSNQSRVLELLFSYINLLHQNKFDKLYFDEQKAMLDIAFNYQERSEPLHLTSNLSRALQHSPVEEVLYEPYALTNFDEKIYRNYLELLNPKNMLLAIKAKDIEGNKKTKWYEAPYMATKLSDSFIEKLASQTPDPNLALPQANIFIPDDTNVISHINNEQPELLRKELGLELWHHTDTSFGTPRANLFLTIRSPVSTQSAEALNMTEIMVSLLKDSLNEFSYPAYLAGLHYELYNHMRGITIKISGYSDKQSQLLTQILSTLKFKSFNSERFLIMKERLSRKLANAKDRKPFQQAISKTQNILISPSWSEQERLMALDNIQLESLSEFRQKFFSKMDIAILSSGNIDRASSLSSAQLIESFLLKSAKKTEVERARIRRIASNTDWLDRFVTQHNDTGFIHYIQGKSRSHNERAKYLLLTQLLTSDYYNQIRTEKQLGYIVFATNFELLEVPGLAFIVQSPSTSGADLLEETRAFIDKAVETLAALSEPDLAKHKSSVIANLLKQENTLYARSNIFWQDIDIKNRDFDTKEQLAKSLEKITTTDMVELLRGIKDKQTATLTVYTQQKEAASEQKSTKMKPITDTIVDSFATF